jgi:hypothetical protein
VPPSHSLLPSVSSQPPSVSSQPSSVGSLFNINITNHVLLGEPNQLFLEIHSFQKLLVVMMISKIQSQT